jgi:hypothetical protein
MIGRKPWPFLWIEIWDGQWILISSLSLRLTMKRVA